MDLPISSYSIFKQTALQAVVFDDGIRGVAWKGTPQLNPKRINSFEIHINPSIPEWAQPIALEGVIRKAWYANKHGFVLEDPEIMSILAEYRLAQQLGEVDPYFKYASDRFGYLERQHTRAYHKVTWIGRVFIPQINRAIKQPLWHSNLPWIYYRHKPDVRLNVSSRQIYFSDAKLCLQVADSLGPVISEKGIYYLKYHHHLKEKYDY